MKITNFKLRPDQEDGIKRATVIVTTGKLWWIKTQTHSVYRERLSIYWRWLATGKFTPDHVIENLASSLNARKE